MFRHKGKARKFRQNLGIASLLSFVAGVVNVVGVLAVQRLTTNVTGHFAFLVEEAAGTNFHQAVYYFLYIFSFFFGALFSRLLIEFTSRLNEKYIFIVPVVVEIAILTVIALLSYDCVLQNPNAISCALLFAMGLQNSLVTVISNSVVRTTHLTGLFTDMGIEVAQLFFSGGGKQRSKLIASIELRFTIIAAFFLGGITAGFLFPSLRGKTLLIASSILVIGLMIDYMTIRIRLAKISTKKAEPAS